MKMLMMGLTVISCAITAWGDIFQMDRKGDAIVEVRKSANEYKVTCKFRPQTKFDKAVNAKFNDAKGDSLCKKGLARYLKVATNEVLTVAGLYSAAPVETVGERLCYSFGVPVSGCTVEKADVKPQQPNEPKTPAVAVDAKPEPPVMTNKSATVDSEPPQKSTNVVAKTSSFLCVVKYKEINGERKTISRREYQGHNFKSQKEFDRFCQAEFARIRALGEENLRAVRNFRK
jgi:hypothetical protein